MGRRKKAVVLILGILLLLIIREGISWKNRIKEVYNYGWDVETENFKLWEYDEESDTVCVVTERKTDEQRSVELNSLNNEYFYIAAGKGFRYDFIPTVYFYWKARIDVYNLKTRELFKSYSLKDFKANLEDIKILGDLNWTTLSKKDGHPCLYLETPDNSILGRLKIDMETNEFYMTEESRYNSTMTEKYEKEIDILDSHWGVGGDNPLYLANGFGRQDSSSFWSKRNEDGTYPLREDKAVICETGNDNGMVKIGISGDALPQNNELLYERFPQLKEFRGDNMAWVNLFLSGSPTPEEILKLLMEEGREISFEGCVMSAGYSRDGKEHVINSFEDYHRWRDFEYIEEGYK